MNKGWRCQAEFYYLNSVFSFSIIVDNDISSRFDKANAALAL